MVLCYQGNETGGNYKRSITKSNCTRNIKLFARQGYFANSVLVKKHKSSHYFYSTIVSFAHLDKVGEKILISLPFRNLSIQNTTEQNKHVIHSRHGNFILISFFAGFFAGP